MSNCIYIYGLIDPDSYEMKYVGATNDVGERFLSHIEHTNGSEQNKKEQWIKQLKEQNKKPLLTIFEKVKLENAVEAETKWAEKYKETILNHFPVVPYLPREHSKSIPISLRLSPFVLYRVKQMAEEQNIKYQTMIKNWIEEKVT